MPDFVSNQELDNALADANNTFNNIIAMANNTKKTSYEVFFC